MKKLIILLLSCFTLNMVSAQTTMSNLFDGTTKVTFLGLDFTQAKFIGQDGFNDPAKIKTYYLQEWNNKLVEEYDKYNLMSVLRIKNYTTEVDDLILLNDGYNVEANIINGTYSITEKEVAKSVSRYKLSNTEGMGISYVI